MTGWLRHSVNQRDQRLTVDGPMGPDLVVVSAPSLQPFRRIRERQGPVSAQAFGPEAAVEGFDEGIFCQLADLDKSRVTLWVQVPKDKLGTLIMPDRLQRSQPGAGPIQRLDHFPDR